MSRTLSLSCGNSSWANSELLALATSTTYFIFADNNFCLTRQDWNMEGSSYRHAQAQPLELAREPRLSSRTSSIAYRKALFCRGGLPGFLRVYSQPNPIHQETHVSCFVGREPTAETREPAGKHVGSKEIKTRPRLAF
jgi:hypothetical protein